MWEMTWSLPSWLWPFSWSEMVTSLSSTSSSCSNDDIEEAAAAAATTTATTTSKPQTSIQQQSSSNSSSGDYHGDSADDVAGIAWENAIEKLLETPIGATEFGEELDQNSNHQENKKGNDVNATCLHHVRQLDSWDCGVACLLMVWEWQSSHDMMNHHHQQKQQDVDIDNEYRKREAARREWILEKIATRSVWTADIVYILDLILQNPPHLMQPQSTMVQMVNILFCSNILQVNESLHGIEYYTKNFEQDKHRVRHRFDVIRERGIPLLQHPPSKYSKTGGLPLAQVVRLIEQPDCIAIALVDNSILACSGSKVAVASVGNQHPTVSAAAPYTGHFIILTGTSRDAKDLKQASTTSAATSTSSNIAGGSDDDYCFVAYNPGVDETISYICPSLLERAWRAEGTDEDIIFLYKTTRVAVPS